MPTTPKKHIYDSIEEAEDMLRGVMSGEYEFHRPKILTVAGQRVTEKMIRFVREYVIDFNRVEAAERSGYSKNSRAALATELMQKPVIIRMIELANEKSRENATVRKDDVLNQYKWLALSDIKNYYCMREAYNKDGESIGEIPVLKSLNDLTPDQSAAIKEIYMDNQGTMRVKLWEKPKALDALANHLKMMEQTFNLKSPALDSIALAIGITREMTEEQMFEEFENKLRPQE